MEQNTNQVTEAQKDILQKEVVEKATKKTNAPITVLLLLIIVILIAIVGYKSFQKETVIIQTKESTGQITTQKETTTTVQDLETGTDTGTGTTIKPDIDADLKTLDKLDLSGIEKDYGDDSLSGF